MLTDQDIQKLKKVLATRKDVRQIRSDVALIREDIIRHDKKFEAIAETINERPTTEEMQAMIDRTYKLALLQTEHNRMKHIIKEKLRVEV